MEALEKVYFDKVHDKECWNENERQDSIVIENAVIGLQLILESSATTKE